MKILEGIIKADEDCINAIYSQMKVKDDNDEDIQYYKKEIQSIKNIVNNYLKEKARADKLEKEYSAMSTKSDEDECDYKRVSKENEQLRTEVNSLKKENEELNEKILDNAGIYQLGFKDGEESYIKKVKDKIRKNEEIIDISNDGDLIHELYQKNKVYEELLESEK